MYIRDEVPKNLTLDAFLVGCSALRRLHLFEPCSQHPHAAIPGTVDLPQIHEVTTMCPEWLGLVPQMPGLTNLSYQRDGDTSPEAFTVSSGSLQQVHAQCYHMGAPVTVKLQCSQLRSLTLTFMTLAVPPQGCYDTPGLSKLKFKWVLFEGNFWSSFQLPSNLLCLIIRDGSMSVLPPQILCTTLLKLRLPQNCLVELPDEITIAK